MPLHLVAGLLLAVVIGLSLGILGGGGAILTVPVLVYVVGLDVKSAVPTSLVVVGLTSLVGAVGHQRAGNVSVRTVVTFGPAVMAGAVAGAALGLLVGPRFQLALFGVVVLSAAVLMLRPAAPPLDDSARRPKSVGLLVGLGALVGVLSGLLGVGGGFLYVPALGGLGGLAMRQAVGTSLVLIAMGAAAGLAGYLGRVELDWALVAAFTALAMIGVGIGSALVPRMSGHSLRRGFALLLLVIGILVLVRR
jgi:uncharacterized membrane protein YfcA